MTLAVSFIPEAAPAPARRPTLRAVSAGDTAALPDRAAVALLDPRLSPAGGSIAVLHPPVGREAVAPVRLTRRGVAVLSVAVAVLGLALVWFAARSAPSGHVPSSAPARVTVHAGDTLWSIALRVAPQADPRAEVAALQQANRLHGVHLLPGQVLRVPR